MLKRSTLQLLRFHFSIFLMPVYFFALSQVIDINWKRATLIFAILHLMVYPASNGYNSYMDRDSESIGGIKNPMQPTRELFIITIVMDLLAITLSFFISTYFAIGICAYILASRAYSYRGIRLKRFPVVGYLTVIIFQGAVTFWLVYYGSSENLSTQIPWVAMIGASLLLGGFYPLTQIYQHDADLKDGVKTISYMLGYRGTFIFTGIIYLFAFIALTGWFLMTLQENKLLVLQIFFVPVIVYFLIWAVKVWKDVSQANFKNTMRLNIIASLFTNLGFITLLIWKVIE